MSVTFAPPVVVVDQIHDVPLSLDSSLLRLSYFVLKRDVDIQRCIVLHTPSSTKDEQSVPVRIHSACMTSEIFGSRRCDCSWQLEHAIEIVEKNQCGMVVYLLDQEGRGLGLATKLRTMLLMDSGFGPEEAAEHLGVSFDIRGYWPAIATLHAFGVSKIDLITNNPRKLAAVQSSGITVTSRIPSIMSGLENQLPAWLAFKRDISGHLF
jgi:GTP cyclohydrolase II